MSDSTPALVPIDPSTQSPEPPKKKKRGAPFGNQNAFRHGFYARNLGTTSPQEFDERELRNLMGEVAMLKDFMFNIYTTNLESTDGRVLTQSLRALSLAGVALSRLLLTHDRVRPCSGATPTLDDLLHTLDAFT